MPHAKKRSVPSLWSLALDRLAHARNASWLDGLATEATWDTVHAGEAALLAAASTPLTIGEKLHYLLAIAQPPDISSLPVHQQPWRHRLLRSAISDLVRLDAVLAAAQAEARRSRRATCSPPQAGTLVTRLREQLTECKAELDEAAGERDSALAALMRANQQHAVAAFRILQTGPLPQ